MFIYNNKLTACGLVLLAALLSGCPSTESISSSIVTRYETDDNSTVDDNQIPIAAPSADSETYSGATVVLDASASSDADGDIVSYHWSQLEGTSVSINNAESAVAEFTAPAVDSEANLSFRLIVIDNNDSYGRAELTITVLDNSAPIANAGADDEVQEGDTVELDASGSFDAEANIATYQWSQIREDEVAISINNADASVASFVAPEVSGDSNLILELTVTDVGGQQDSDILVVNVRDSASQQSSESQAEPQVAQSAELYSERRVILGNTESQVAQSAELHAEPQVILGNINNTYQAPGTIASLSAAVSDDSAAIASYSWRETTTNGIAIARADSAHASFIVPESLAVGSVLSFALTASDSNGASATATTSLTVVEPGSRKWQFDAGAASQSSPAIAPDGSVYIASSDGKLYALDPADGSVQWSHQIDEAINSALAIAADGSVYVGSQNHLYAIAPPSTSSAKRKWRYTSSSALERTAPAIAADGTIYIASGHGLHALDPIDGSLLWRFPTSAAIAAPAIAADGSVYFASSDGKLYAVASPSDDSQLGVRQWHYNTGGAINSAPTIAEDGSIYIASSEGKLYALNPPSADNQVGVLQWSYDTGASIQAAPSIGAAGEVYIASADGNLHVIDPESGKRQWHYPIGAAVRSAASIGADGAVYIGSVDGKLHAIAAPTDASGVGVLQWLYTSSGSIEHSAPAITTDGSIYFTSSDGKLHVLNSTSAGLAPSPWPKPGYDNSGASRANRAPIAQAQASAPTVRAGATVELDASASTDPDGVIIDYYWRETSGYGISIQDNNSAHASFIAPDNLAANAELTIQLSVTDNSTTTTTTTLNINIEI